MCFNKQFDLHILYDFTEKPFLEDLRVTSGNNEIQIHYQHRVSEKSPNVTDIRWEKNESSLDLKNSKYFGGSYKENCLKIKFPEEEDSGLYTCTVINAAGSVTKKTALGKKNTLGLLINFPIFFIHFICHISKISDIYCTYLINCIFCLTANV